MDTTEKIFLVLTIAAILIALYFAINIQQKVYKIVDSCKVTNLVGIGKMNKIVKIYDCSKAVSQD